MERDDIIIRKGFHQLVDHAVGQHLAQTHLFHRSLRSIQRLPDAELDQQIQHRGNCVENGVCPVDRILPKAVFHKHKISSHVRFLLLLVGASRITNNTFCVNACGKLRRI